MIAFGRVLSREEIIATIDRLDVAQIRRAGARALRSAPTVAAIGPVAKVLHSRPRRLAAARDLKERTAVALFRSGPSQPKRRSLVRGDGLYLRPPEMRDFEAWAELRERSRAFLTPWEPTWPGDDLTRASFRRRVRRNQQEIDNDEAYPFLIFRDDDVLLGGLTLGQVKRGVVQAATLGYWIGAPLRRQGFMFAARCGPSIGLPSPRSGCTGSRPRACPTM